MPTGYVFVDARTVRGPDGREHDVLDAIPALPWTPQLCPLMLHEYSIRGKGPDWAWDGIAAMLVKENPNSFRAYFRGYGGNRYWDAPDGLRYWRGNLNEIDRGQRDRAGLRLRDEGAKPAKDWDGPRHAPDGIGLYERDDKGHWWPTDVALASGYLPCRSCQQTNKKAAIVKSLEDPHGVADFIAAATSERGRPLDREELSRALERYPARPGGPPSRSHNGRTELDRSRVGPPVPAKKLDGSMASSDVPKAQVVRKLLELRAREAPLGSSGYRGVLTQKAIADVAGVRVQDVTKAAIELDREMNEAEPREVK